MTTGQVGFELTKVPWCGSELSAIKVVAWHCCAMDGGVRVVEFSQHTVFNLN